MPLLLLVSLGCSVLLFKQAKHYYKELNATRLDPLGLQKFPAPTDSPQPTLAFYGDSRAEQWPAPQVLAGATQNFGIGGQTTAQILARFDRHFTTVKPKIILIQAGINDLKAIPLFPESEATIIANCKQNLGAMVARSRQLGVRVIITTIFPLGELPLLRRPFWSDRVDPAIAEVNQYLISLASPEVTVVVTADLLADQQGQLIPAYSHDLLHLSVAGYQRLNQELSARLESIIDNGKQP
jgi:lysophospholipase L1-like esterase